jgi:predicted RNA polymerase sigma factor
VPDNPGAWLTTTARHRAIDLVRRNKRVGRVHEQLGRGLEAHRTEAAPDLDDIGDDLLRLVSTVCHPVLPTETRVAFTLRLLGGLTSDEIARAFPVPEPTVAQRIVRAKRTQSEKQLPFEVPRGAELAARPAVVRHRDPERPPRWPVPGIDQGDGRGDLLARLGRFDEARREFERAAALTRNAREYELLGRVRAYSGG